MKYFIPGMYVEETCAEHIMDDNLYVLYIKNHISWGQLLDKKIAVTWLQQSVL